MEITIADKRKKKKKQKPALRQVTIPPDVEWRGGETGDVIAEGDYTVVRFADGTTTGYPREMLEGR